MRGKGFEKATTVQAIDTIERNAAMLAQMLDRLSRDGASDGSRKGRGPIRSPANPASCPGTGGRPRSLRRMAKAAAVPRGPSAPGGVARFERRARTRRGG